MVFCGQCGLQVPPGKTACPRCGTPTEPEFNLVAEDLHQNDPTIATLSSYGPGYLPPVGASVPLQQEKLVLRPDGTNHNFSGQAANDLTSVISLQGYQDYPSYAQRTPALPSQPTIDPSNSAYTPQTSQIDQGYQPIASQYGTLPTQAPIRKQKGHTVALLLILLGLMVILGALGLFLLKQNGLLGGNSTSPSQQAQAMISQYYTDINQRDYQSAYNLWAFNSKHPAQPYDRFVAGYAHTQHDDITFDKITPLANGTVRVSITIHASEVDTSGTVSQHTYQGFYLVGQQNGSWKILNGISRR